MSPNTKNLLVVDDELPMTEALKEFLTEEGFNVHTCSGADEALLYLKNNSVHLILSDISMPVKNGLEFFKEFKEENERAGSTPFVLMTGYADIISVENAFKLGVNELIAKPFNLETVSLVINFLTNSGKAYGSEKEIYFSVPLSEFILSKTSDYDIYLKVAAKHIKVTKSGQEFTKQRLDNFIKKGATHIYLDTKDFAKYTDLQFAIAGMIHSRPMDNVKKTRVMNHLMSSVSQSVISDKIEKKTLTNAIAAFESYSQVVLCNSQLSNILDQLLQVSPDLAERSALKGMLCSTVAGMWKWNSAKIQSRVIMSALLCDIGLKDTPWLVSKKRIDFTPEDRVTYEQHPYNSFQILKEVPNLPEEILLVALQHHENTAGMGFPQRLPRSKIHAFSKLTHGVGEFLDTLSFQEDTGNVHMALDHIHAVQSKMISEQVVKSLYILFNIKLPKDLNDLLLPSETNRVN